MPPLLIPNHRVVPQGLVGHWGYAASGGSVAANGIIRDASGFKNDAKLLNGGIVDPGGIQLTAANTYVTVANRASLALGTNPFSVVMQFKTYGSTWGSANPELWEKQQTSALLVQLQATGSVVKFAVVGGGVSASVDITRSVVKHNTWHHITCIRAEDGLSIYHQGAFVAFAPSAAANVTNTSAFWIGRGNNGYLAATVDDFRIYNRALSAGETQRLYQATRKA
jgi:hypothetical protein